MSKFTVIAWAALASLTSAWASAIEPDPRVALGERLFAETRFHSPLGDLDIGCATCHTRADNVGYRGFSDPLGRSWQPWRREDPVRETLRNAPGLLDLANHDFIHADGEFPSLEAQTQHTLTGRNFGWLPQEHDTALRTVASLLRSEYASAFKTAYAVDLATVDDEACARAASKAIADFVRSLKSIRTSPYDEFLRANGLDDGPRAGEGPATYGVRLLKELATREAATTLVKVDGFGDEAIAGYRIFLRSNGAERTGNCVTCHVPPAFTDRSFHNMGVTQEEYDAAHGSGSFAKLEIPSSGARPRREFMQRPRRDHPGEADLGYWNFARYENSPLYHPQEAEPEFRARTIATFKTPPLRNLPSTPPYMHNGAYTTLEATLHQIMEAAFLARMGDLRNADPELASIHIQENDFAALFAFLNALSDAGTRTAEFTSTSTTPGSVAPSGYSYRPNQLDLVGTEDDPAAAAAPASPGLGTKPD